MSSPSYDLSDAIHLLCNEISKNNEWYNYSVEYIIGKRFGKLTVVFKTSENTLMVLFLMNANMIVARLPLSICIWQQSSLVPEPLSCYVNGRFWCGWWWKQRRMSPSLQRSRQGICPWNQFRQVSSDACLAPYSLCECDKIPILNIEKLIPLYTFFHFFSSFPGIQGSRTP